MGLLSKINDKAEASAAEREREKAEAAAMMETRLANGEMFEYRVETVGEAVMGKNVNTTILQQTLTKFASEGWRVKEMTTATVMNAIKSTEGVIIVFERRLYA